MGTRDAQRHDEEPAGMLVLDGGLPETPLAADRQAPVTEHIRAALDRRLRALVEHDPGTRAGNDPEELHQMRVSVRRMRAVLRSGRPFLDRSWSEPLRAELGWLGRSLGPVRDLDVLLMELRAETAGFSDAERRAAEHLIAALRDEHAEARDELLRALGSPRYRDLLTRLVATVRSPLPASESDVDSRAALRGLIGREYRKLRQDVKRAGPEPTDARLHELRIRGKRLRYSAELAAELFGTKASTLLKAAKAFQDVLGEHQDASFADQRVRDLLDGLGEPPGTGVAFVAGRLVEHQASRRAGARELWWPRWRELRHRAEALTGEQP